MLQELLRAESLQAEESQLTFRPSINEHYQTSGPRLKLSNPGPYLAHVQARAAKRRESLLRAKSAAEVGTPVLMGRAQTLCENLLRELSPVSSHVQAWCGAGLMAR